MNKTQKIEHLVIEGLQVVGAILTCVVLIFALVVCFRNGKNENIGRYDVSALEQWAKNDECGQVRMLGAWVVGADSGDGATWFIEDEQGQVWKVCNDSITRHDSLLLWIDDRGTEVTFDDVIVRVWREAY